MGRTISRAAIGVTYLALSAGIAAAQPAPARPVPPRPAAPASAPVAPPAPADKKPDPAFEAARASFEALPEADRRALQEALVWTGDFNGVDSGTFGRRTFDSILAYARRTKPSATPAVDAVLDASERAALLAAGRKARDAAGFALRTDATTGAALGIPARVLPREQRVPNGTRWQSPDGRVTLETRLYAAGEGDLAATFERLAVSTPERRVTYKLKRPDFLVVTGETPTGRFYIRYADTPAGLRGFTFAYDKALATETDKLVIAVANSFNPLPGAAGPGAMPTATSPVPAAPITPSGVTITAIEVAPGRLLTSAAAVAACTTPRINFKAARVIARSDTLALLGAPEPGTPRPGLPALRSGPEPRTGDALIVLASDGSAASAIPAGAATATRVTAPLQPGAAGAPVFDRAGRLVGLVASYPGAPRLIAGIAPPAGYDILTLAGAATFLRENGITFSTTGGEAPGTQATVTTGEVAGAAGPAIRSLTCGT